MYRTSLERKILCGETGRMADVELAVIFLREALERPVRDYFEGNRKLCEYVVEELGGEADLEDLWEEADYVDFPLTYGDICQNFAEKHRKGEKVDARVVRAFTYIYHKMRMEPFPDPKRKKVEQKAAGVKSLSKRAELNERIERARERAKEAEEKKKAEEEKPKKKGLYSRLGEETSSTVEADFFLINHINMKEYFQAVSVITQREEDAEIPDTLPFGENLTIEEMMLKECDSEETYLERIYTLLIEPFAKMQDKMDRDMDEEELEIDWM